MKGILYKDFVLLIKTNRIYLALIALFVGISLISKKSQSMLYYTFVFSAMLSMGMIASDEKDKWDEYSCTLPVTRGACVSSKYLLNLILISAPAVLFSVFYCIIHGVSDFPFAVLASAVAVGLIANSVNMPVIYAFGYIVGRYVNLALVFVVFSALGALSFVTDGITGGSISSAAEKLEQNQTVFAAAIICASALMFAASWIISASIYKKRSF